MEYGVLRTGVQRSPSYFKTSAFDPKQKSSHKFGPFERNRSKIFTFQPKKHQYERFVHIAAESYLYITVINEIISLRTENGQQNRYFESRASVTCWMSPDVWSHKLNFIITLLVLLYPPQEVMASQPGYRGYLGYQCCRSILIRIYFHRPKIEASVSKNHLVIRSYRFNFR